MKLSKRLQFVFQCVYLLSLGSSYSFAAPEKPADAPSLYDLAEQQSAFFVAIADIESQNGPYDPQLVELLESAGRLALENEQFEQAAQLYERALNVSRVSAGLQNEEQLRFLPLLVDSLSSAGDWEAADDRMQLSMYLQRRLLDIDSEEFAQAVIHFSDWKLAAINNPEISISELRELSELTELHDLVLEALLPDGERHSHADEIQALFDSSFSDSTKADLLNQLALSRLQEIESRLDALDSQIMYREPRYVYRTVCQSQKAKDGSVTEVCYEQKVDNPRFLEQQNIIRNTANIIERTRRQYSYTLEALRGLQAETPQLVMHDGSTIGDTVDRLSELETELERSLRSSRF